MSKFRHSFHIFAIILCLLNIVELLEGALPSNHLFPVPVPVSTDHVKWNSGALHSIPSTLNFINNIKHGDALINNTCIDHFLMYAEAFGNLNAWALQMFDSSTKIPESVASNAMVHLGNFDQCLAVKALDSNGQHAFNGQYCGTTVLLNEGVPPTGNFSLFLQIASCIPSTCTPLEFNILFHAALSTSLALLDITAVAIVNPDNCYIEGDKPALDAATWVVISIFILIALEVMVFTACDVLKIKTKSEKVDSILKSYSLARNLKSLMKTEHSKGSIQCLNGLRACSILWVMIGHRYSVEFILPKINSLQMYDSLDNFFMQLILNAMPSVDTFFFISGFLVCYLLMKDLNKGNKFNPIIYYVHRYLRLTTSYATVIAFYSTILAYIGYGPLWHFMNNTISGGCKYSWWTGLLYVDNYVQFDYYIKNNAPSICIGQGWYLSVDMQLSWLAPLVLLPLYYWPNWTLKFMVPLVLASCFAPFTSTYINEFTMNTDVTDISRSLEYMMVVYIPTYMRATPYLMGICLAYLMYKRSEGIRMSKWLVICGWMLSTVVALTVIFSPTIQYQDGYEYDRVGAAFYAGFSRLAWSFVIGWIILACHYGYGGPVNKILSWKGWLPLSRLSYCMFLVHFFIMYLDIFQARTLVHYNLFSVLQRYSGDVIFSIILSLILHLCVEAPTLGLLKTFLKRPSSTGKSEVILPTS